MSEIDKKLTLRQLVDKLRYKSYNTTEIMILTNARRWPTLRRLRRLEDKGIVVKRRLGRYNYYFATRPFVEELRRTPKYKPKENRIDRLARSFGISREEFLRLAEEERKIREATALPKRVKFTEEEKITKQKEVKYLPISIQEWQAGKDVKTVPLDSIMQPSLAYSTAELAAALGTSNAAARARLVRAEKEGLVQHKKIKGRVVWALVGK